MSDIFNRAKWIINSHETGFTAQSTGCMLAAIAKNTSAPCPCSIYCLNPMEGMVKALVPNARYEVSETLWSGKKCKVDIERSGSVENLP